MVAAWVEVFVIFAGVPAATGMHGGGSATMAGSGTDKRCCVLGGSDLGELEVEEGEEDVRDAGGDVVLGNSEGDEGVEAAPRLRDGARARVVKWSGRTVSASLSALGLVAERLKLVSAEVEESRVRGSSGTSDKEAVWGI